MEKIASLQNTRVKNVVALAGKSKERKQAGLFVVEGAREIGIAIRGGYSIQTLFVYPPLLPSDWTMPEVENVFEVSQPVFEKMAYRKGTDGLVAILKQKELSLENLSLPENPFIIVLESVEKPGNLGAILRTADAAKVDAVIVCDPQTDVYNPNAVRSSIGCLFTLQIACCSSEDALSYLKRQGVKILAAELEASQWYHQTDMRAANAVVMGAEADGLTDFWLTSADARIKIPMRGIIDSLNVSVSTAVITFEAMRQRGFK
ncbi:MAG: RNA methyltransferase [Prevotellaceae bacterium]|jgi:TrmH family RNA methyltransferase|nr:RNA methyltransferase [Prevotellaceae bacterium]